MDTVEIPEVVDDATREMGRAHEVAFWRDFVRSDRCKIGWCDAIPNPELDSEIYLFLRGLAAMHAKSGRMLEILDIGSGPVSMLTNAFPDYPVRLRAADPLGSDYDALWDDLDRKNRVVRPDTVAGEKLVERYGRHSFDVTHIRNAIDHAAHPIIVLEQMIGITRPGGFVIVHGFQDEAAAEGYEGFHQWNMKVARDDLEFESVAGRKYLASLSFPGQLVPVFAGTRVLAESGKAWCCYVAVRT